MQEDILSFKWDEDIKERAVKIEEGLYALKGSTEKDLITLRTLQLWAVEENNYGSTKSKSQSYMLLFDSKKEKYLGFIVWTMNEGFKDFKGSDILKQIYIIKSQRNNGYGTKFLKFWVENYANKVNGRFGIELCIDSPLIPILTRLGYVERVEDRIKPIKFYVTPEF